VPSACLRAAERTEGHGLKLPERSSTGTLAASVLVYAAWSVASAAAIIMVGQPLAVLVAQAFPLSRAEAGAGIVTALAAVAGLGAPAAVARLRLDPARIRARRHD
jgi:hypothetical protein